VIKHQYNFWLIIFQKRQTGNGRTFSTSSWTQWSTEDDQPSTQARDQTSFQRFLVDKLFQKWQTGNGHAFTTSTSATVSFQAQGVPPTAIMPGTEFTLDAERNPSQNLDAVTDFLMSKVNKSISAKSVDRIVTLLQSNKEGVSSLFCSSITK